ncbi:MAG TPA: FAD-dependent oxidoreductase [Thermomicrobiaceae bacterium]|nr:FAD-dependent oxidoreductase [Thermomicrobiaceae bacterium]
METADVVVVGAGANGTSTAWHLARAGVKRVVVVERRHIGAGATGKSGALVRTHYTNEPETRLAFESHKYFANWGDVVGGECGFQRVGLLVFVAPEFDDQLEANVAMHREVGANAHLISPEQARELDPSLWAGDVKRLAYEPDSGYADPNATAFAFARGAESMGVSFKLDTQVTRIRVDAGRVLGVETTDGTIEAPVVVLTAGAWANQLLNPLGIDLGMTPSLARVSVFRWAYERSAQHLTYIDRINHTWARPTDANSTLIGGEQGVRPAADPNTFAEAVSQDYIDQCRAHLVQRWPAMRHASVRGNWQGVLMRSPDDRPVIDRMPQVDGLYCMTGDSGTSFKTSPAIGKCLAEWITVGSSQTVDLTPFRSTRFAEGKPWRDENDYGVASATISR